MPPHQGRYTPPRRLWPRDWPTLYRPTRWTHIRRWLERRYRTGGPLRGTLSLLLLPIVVALVLLGPALGFSLLSGFPQNQAAVTPFAAGGTTDNTGLINTQIANGATSITLPGGFYAARWDQISWPQNFIISGIGGTRPASGSNEGGTVLVWPPGASGITNAMTFANKGIILQDLLMDTTFNNSGTSVSTNGVLLNSDHISLENVCLYASTSGGSTILGTAGVSQSCTLIASEVNIAVVGAFSITAAGSDWIMDASRFGGPAIFNGVGTVSLCHFYCSHQGNLTVPGTAIQGQWTFNATEFDSAGTGGGLVKCDGTSNCIASFNGCIYYQNQWASGGAVSIPIFQLVATPVVTVTGGIVPANTANNIFSGFCDVGGDNISVTGLAFAVGSVTLDATYSTFIVRTTSSGFVGNWKNVQYGVHADDANIVTINGTTGSVQWSMPEQRNGMKRFYLTFIGYINTGAATVITYPRPFSQNPYFVATNASTPNTAHTVSTGGGSAISTTKTALTLPAGAGMTAVSDSIEISGF